MTLEVLNAYGRELVNSSRPNALARRRPLSDSVSRAIVIGRLFASNQRDPTRQVRSI